MSNKSKTAGQARNTAGAYPRFEAWAQLKDKAIFLTLLLLSIFLSLLTFNARISEAHDDALYLEGGWRFVNEFPDYFYTQNAPLYVMFLALLVKLAGFKLMLFKLFSLVFSVSGFALFYRSLQGRIPAIVFLPVAFFHAVNHLIMYYASMTFTEAFYFFLQGLLFFYSVKIIDLLKVSKADIRTQAGTWLMFGLSMFLISTAKSAAIVVIPAVILYFFIEKNYRAIGFAMGSYLLFKGAYEFLVKMVWGTQNQFSGQSKILLQKDPYDRTQGNEDVMGFVQRFIDNCNLSFSKRFYQLLGWKDELSTETQGFITIVTIALALYGFWKLLQHGKKELVFMSLFTGAQVVLSFIILQARWDQPRITLVCMPILLVMMIYGLYCLSQNRPAAQTGVYVLLLLMTGSVFISSLKRAGANVPVIKRNLKGDKYYGYTPDWQNFLRCSEWCSENLPDSALVASRKAPMSFVYGNGKKFFPVYSVVKRDTSTQQSHPDSALAYFRQNKVTHVMLGSLRVNPHNPDAGIINTVHHIMAPIAQKYPEKLKVVHTEGALEPTEVYELLYDAPAPASTPIQPAP